MGTPPPEDVLPRDHSLPPHLQSPSSYMRPAPSASPPIQNGLPYNQRQHILFLQCYCLLTERCTFASQLRVIYLKAVRSKKSPHMQSTPFLFPVLLPTHGAMHIRLATTRDLPRLTWITVTSLVNDPAFDYLWPKRHSSLKTTSLSGSFSSRSGCMIQKKRS